MSRIRKVRVLFVIFAIVFLAIMLGLIIFFSYQNSYAHMIENADSKLSQILEDESKVDATEHYFIAYIDSEHKLSDVKLVNVSRDVANNISNYVKFALTNESDIGYVDGFRYMCRKDKRYRSVTIAFISRSGNEAMLWQNVKSMIKFSIIGIGVVAVALIFISKLVVWPIEESERRQKEFIAAASHGLKTPLTIISTSADLLKEDNSDNEWVDIIKEQADYMSDMTNNLVMITKLEASSKAINRIEFPISDVVCEIIRSFSPVAESKHQLVQSNIENNVSYYGNENDIMQLFTLLIDNAHKYAGENGKITIDLRQKKNEVEFIIKNTSKYYEKKQLDKLFDRFYRDSEAKEKGFGIGLYVAKTIVDRHNGSIKAYMEDNNGENEIVFFIRLK